MIDAPVDETPEAATELVAGKYRLTRLLGRGGMGSVWEGVHQSLGTRVAVKFIDSEYAESDEFQRRFDNEAKATAQLDSKYAVKVFDQGRSQDGRAYIVMEFLSGESCEERVTRQGRLPLSDVAVLVRHVARALTRAHGIGIVHRDLKPDNIFIVRDDEDQTESAKVVDFGVAKFTEHLGGEGATTQTGAVLGTPQYMSPEQARGLKSVDARSDLWSLGVIAFRAATGELPFQGQAVGDLLVKICTAPAPVPSELDATLPKEFDAFCTRALEKEPDARFQTAEEMANALWSAAGLSASLKGPTSIGGGSVRAGKRSPAPAASVTDTSLVASYQPPRSRGPWWFALVGALLLTAGLVWALRTPDEPPALAGEVGGGSLAEPESDSVQKSPEGTGETRRVGGEAGSGAAAPAAEDQASASPPRVAPAKPPPAPAATPRPRVRVPNKPRAAPKPAVEASPKPTKPTPAPKPPDDLLGY